MSVDLHCCQQNVCNLQQRAGDISDVKTVAGKVTFGNTASSDNSTQPAATAYGI